MIRESLIVRSLIYREKTQWAALCLNYNLTVHDASASGALERLKRQVPMHIAHAMAMSSQDARSVLNSKASLRFWMAYFFAMWFPWTSAKANNWRMTLKPTVAMRMSEL